LGIAIMHILLVDGVEGFDPFESDVSAPFNESSIHKFHPSESMSFAQVLFDGFDLKYADTADLRGFIGQDIVQLGHFFSRTKFGCITRCDSADFNGVDGILVFTSPPLDELFAGIDLFCAMSSLCDILHIPSSLSWDVPPSRLSSVPPHSHPHSLPLSA